MSKSERTQKRWQNFRLKRIMIEKIQTNKNGLNSSDERQIARFITKQATNSEAIPLKHKDIARQSKSIGKKIR